MRSRLRERVRRWLEVAGFFDTLENVANWVGRILRWLWPIIGTTVIGLLLLLWGWMRGSFGPELVAIVLAAIVVIAAQTVSLFNGLASRTQRPQIPVADVPNLTPQPTPKDGVREVFNLRVRQGDDLRAALEKTSGYLSKTIVSAIREWGYAANRFLKEAYPGRAAFFIDELPDYRVTVRESYKTYLDKRLADLAAIKKEVGF